MRWPLVLLPCLLCAIACTGCDEREPAVPFKPHSARVQELLAERHQRFADVTTVYVEFEERRDDQIWNESETRSGTLRYVYPGQGRLDLTGKDSESIVATDAGEIWLYRSSQKQIAVFPLATPVRPLCDLGLIPAAYQWLLPLSPELFDARQELQVVQETDEAVYLKGRCHQPGLQSDDRNPDLIEVVLDKQTMYPRKIVLTCCANNERLTYNVTLFKTDRAIDPDAFVLKRLEGWSVCRFGPLRPGMTLSEFLAGTEVE